MVIYVDLLLLFNLTVHYCLLSSTALLAGVKVRFRRLMAGAMLGSLFSFAIFLECSVYEFMGMKCIMAILLILAAFGFHSMHLFIKRILIFLAVNFVYAGAMEAAVGLSPRGMVYRTGVAYFGFDVTAYAFGLLAAFLLLKGGLYLLSKRKGVGRMPVFSVRVGEKTVSGRGMIDSGNRMCDIYSGKPVMVLSRDLAKQLLSDEMLLFITDGTESKEAANFGHKLRVIPVQTVNGSGILTVFAPDDITLEGKRHPDWMAAVSKEALTENCDAILPAAAEE